MKFRLRNKLVKELLKEGANKYLNDKEFLRYRILSFMCENGLGKKSYKMCLKLTEKTYKKLENLTEIP